jgi:hypothetical protein
MQGRHALFVKATLNQSMLQHLTQQSAQCVGLTAPWTSLKGNDYWNTLELIFYMTQRLSALLRGVACASDILHSVNSISKRDKVRKRT